VERNENIVLCEKWLHDPESVSAEELRLNKISAASKSGSIAEAYAFAAAAFSHGLNKDHTTYWVDKFKDLEKLEELLNG